MRKVDWFISFVAVCVLLPATAFAVVEGARLPKTAIVPRSAQERQGWIDRAHTLFAIDRDGRSLIQGPKHKKFPFEFNDRVECDFTEPDPQDPPNGASPKIYCNANGVDIKVKYQNPTIKNGLSIERNDGIWGEVLSTRLLWALGFPANTSIPVHLICRNCPPRPWHYVRYKLHLDPDDVPGPWMDEVLAQPRVTLDIPDAIIEAKLKTPDIEQTAHQGWSWGDEFDHPNADVKAERDALALLAAFIQYADNKAENQRLICLDAGEGTCHTSALELHDLGMTFGFGFVPAKNAGLEGDAAKQAEDASKRLSQSSLRGFTQAPLWSDEKNCLTNVNYAPTINGVPANKTVSEAGRKLLVSRLQTLSDQDLRDLFTVARIDRRGETIGDGVSARPVTVEDWVQAFKAKVQALSQTRCP